MISYAGSARSWRETPIILSSDSEHEANWTLKNNDTSMGSNNEGCF